MRTELTRIYDDIYLAYEFDEVGNLTRTRIVRMVGMAYRPLSQKEKEEFEKHRIKK